MTLLEEDSTDLDERSEVGGIDCSHPWTGVGADEFFKLEYETPPGGEWFISYAEPFDLDPGVSDISELDVLDAAVNRLRARGERNGVENSIERVFSVQSALPRAERISKNAGLLIKAMRKARESKG